MLFKILAGEAAAKAFKKAGGVKGITEKGKKAAERLAEHGKKAKTAVSHKSVEEGAEVAGQLANDAVSVAKDAGEATVEIATETYEDLKSTWQKAKAALKGENTPEDSAPQQTENTEQQNPVDGFLAAIDNPATQQEGLMQLAAYLLEGNSISSADAEKLFDSVEKTDMTAEDKTMIQEALLANTDDKTPGQNYLKNQGPKGQKFG